MNDDTERRLGILEGDMKVAHSKLDNLITSVDKLSNGIGQRVQAHGESISSLQTNMDNHASYIEAVSEKVDKRTKEISEKIDKHEKSPGHWQFLVIIAVIVSIIGGIVGFIK